MNKVMLRRARLLSNAQYKPVILTNNFHKDYKAIERELRATGKLHPDVEMLNVYDYYRDKFSSQTISQASRELYEKSRIKFEDDYWVEDGGDYARYFENGHYVKYKRWAEDGSLSIIDYFDDNRVRTSRDEFHPIGFKARETLYHPANNKKNQENYYTQDGFCYLTVWYNYETGAQQRIFLFDPKFPKVIDFKNRVEFQSYWLEELCRLEAVKPIVISESASVADRVEMMKDENAFKIFMLHNNHLNAPYTKGSDFVKGTLPILESIPKGYTTVVLTEEQRLDLHSDIGNRGNIKVIQTPVESTNPIVARQDNLFTMATRLVDNKQVDHAIKAMEKVVQAFPTASLEIYGVGPEMKNLQKLITDLKLKKNVSLQGYNFDLDIAYSRSLATLVTSKAEGTSTAMQEAASNGTPTIAYKIKYDLHSISNMM